MITIHEVTLREASLDGCNEEDAVVYDQKIGEYYQHLSQTAEPHGIEITFSESDPGTYCYYADSDREHHFWAHSLDFWEWYHTRY